MSPVGRRDRPQPPDNPLVKSISEPRPLWIEDWQDEAVECIPLVILEFDHFKPENFDVVTAHSFRVLRRLYLSVDPTVREVVDLIHDIGTNDLYDDIAANGAPTSLRYLKELLSLLEELGVDPPDVKAVSFSRFSSHRGWGSAFAADELRRVVNVSAESQSTETMFVPPK